MTAATSVNNDIYNNISARQIIIPFVWLTFFLNGMVIKEPAPCDLFMMGFIIIIPLCGFARFTRLHILFLVLWMIVLSFGLVAAVTHEFYTISLRHMLISGYLAVFSVVLAAYLTKNPLHHFGIIWNGYMCGAIIASVVAIIGYFDLIPGTYELLTKYGRARGTFKDPNVFGPYLVPAFLYCLHHLLSHSLKKGFFSLLLMSVFLFGILMCFSRGAWLLFLVASSLYIGIFFIMAPNNRQRMRTVFLCVASLFVFLGVVAGALQSSKVQKLWDVRASLNQDYDVGDQGRFAGHKKAMNIILEKPIGIGALYFGYFYHHELPHNLYLSMYLSTGWIGGTVFLFLILATLLLGGLILFRRSPWAHYHAITYCSFVGLAIESYIIDSDHWRLLYILMGLIWGAYAAAQIEDRAHKVGK